MQHENLQSLPDAKSYTSTSHATRLLTNTAAVVRATQQTTNRPATAEDQLMALLEAVSSVVLYNSQAVVSRLDVEALSM